MAKRPKLSLVSNAPEDSKPVELEPELPFEIEPFAPLPAPRPPVELTRPIPAYLQSPPPPDRPIGTVHLTHDRQSWVIEAQPHVTEMAKRLFHGSRGLGSGRATIPSTRRNVGDLNWLLLRFPLTMSAEDSAAYAVMLRSAQEHSEVLARAVEKPQRLAPKLLLPLRPYQEEGVAHLVNNRRTLLADSPGLGKTAQIIGFLVHEQSWPALIIVPPHLVINWAGTWAGSEYPGEIEKFLGKGCTVHVIRGQKPYKLPLCHVYVMHYLLLTHWRKTLCETKISTVGFDEIQELRHHDTAKYSAASAIASVAENVIGASGTPIHNHGAEIWSVLNILEFNCLGNREAFTREYCTVYGGSIVSDPEVLGSHLRAEGLFLRRRMEDVLPDLPTKRRVIQQIGMDDTLYAPLIEQAIRAAAAVKDAKDEFDARRLRRIAIENSRQACGVAKAPYVAAFVQALLEAEEPVLLFAYHHAVFAEYMERLKDWNPVEISGRVPDPKAKKEAEAKFERGDTNLCVMSLRAGQGLNFPRARVVAFGELDWAPAIHCLDERTEILTPAGFRGADDIREGDPVAGFDLATEEIRFVPALAKVDRIAGPDETFHRVKTTRVDLAITGQHRMVVRNGRRALPGRPTRTSWRIESAADLVGKKRRWIPTAGHEHAKGVSLLDDELRFIGLALSDGHFDGRTTIIVYQSARYPWNADIVRILNGAGVAWSKWVCPKRGQSDEMNWYLVPSGLRPRWTEGELTEMLRLKSLGVKYSEIALALDRTTNAVTVKLGKIGRGVRTPPLPNRPRKGWMAFKDYVIDRDLSPLLDDVTAEQLECLLYGLWLGDGRKTHGSVRRITNTNRTLVERLQSLCVRRGMSARLVTRKDLTSAGNPIYDLDIRRSGEAYLQDGKDRGRLKADERPAAGQRVWCVENELGTIVIRRNGKVAIVGNCQCEDRAAGGLRAAGKSSVLAYYLVAAEGSDREIQDHLGLKVSQFVGIMGDKAETEDDKVLAAKSAESHMQVLLARLQKMGKAKGTESSSAPVADEEPGASSATE